MIRATSPDNINILRDIAGNSFAQSLVTQYDRRGDLSQKQWYWVNKLASEATAPKPEAVTGLNRVIEIFDNASSRLKFPKLVIQFADGSDLKLSRAGERSKYSGAVQLTDARPFGENTYFGRVDRDGKLILSGAGQDRAAELESILKSMTADLGKFARMYGQKFGNCCFCRKELTDGRSITAGYGPVCADNYGLPWGEDDDVTEEEK